MFFLFPCGIKKTSRDSFSCCLLKRWVVAGITTRYLANLDEPEALIAKADFIPS